MDTTTGDVIEYREPYGYAYHHIPISRAKRKLLELAGLDAVPKAAYVYWY